MIPAAAGPAHLRRSNMGMVQQLPLDDYCTHGRPRGPDALSCRVLGVPLSLRRPCTIGKVFPSRDGCTLMYSPLVVYCWVVPGQMHPRQKVYPSKGAGVLTMEPVSNPLQMTYLRRRNLQPPLDPFDGTGCITDPSNIGSANIVQFQWS